MSLKTIITPLLLALASAAPASAQWTTANADSAWAGFRDHFYYASGSRAWYTATQGGSASEGIWQSAEMIEATVDEYYFAKANDANPNLSVIAGRIDALCHGLEYNYGDGDGNGSGGVIKNWGTDFTGDLFNDDLMWITIAYTRAYQVTGTAQWLTTAQAIFDAVWARARINGDALHNGLGQKMTYDSATGKYDIPSNADSPVNYTCIIAGYLLSNNGRGSGYKTDADNVYRWAAVPQGNLFNASTGKVPDSTTGSVDYSYNYGIAIHAAALESDGTSCQAMANYLANSFVGSGFQYNGVWAYNGTNYNVLPNYSSNGNDQGYNGICLRGVGYAQTHTSYLTSQEIAWAQENVDAAFHQMNASTSLMHGNWQTATPSTGQGSWDCSAALAGMLNIVAR